jgi:cytochrome c
MDTMTSTKIIGGFCGALLVFLLGNWAAETLYHVGPSGHGEEHAAGYEISVDAEGGEEPAEEAVDFAELVAAADPAKGEKVFGKCKACHKLEEGANGTGPSLYGVVGRAVGSIAGFGYSGARGAVADVWDAEHLNGFLTNPKSYAPGTKMGFAGLKSIDDRANLVAYLETIGN